MSTFPDDTQAGDMFWMNDEPIRITEWNYSNRDSYDRYFDLEFVDIIANGRPAACMVLIPMGFDFFGVTIRKMSSLEKELF